MGHGPRDDLFLQLDENGGCLRDPYGNGKVTFLFLIGQDHHGYFKPWVDGDAPDFHFDHCLLFPGKLKSVGERCSRNFLNSFISSLFFSLSTIITPGATITFSATKIGEPVLRARAMASEGRASRSYFSPDSACSRNNRAKKVF